MKITCRICRIQQGEFFTLDSIVPIYGQRDHKLLDMYNKCLQLNAALQDVLPQVVCLACFEKLKEFFEFQLKAEKSDHELRGSLHETLTKEEKNECVVNYNDPSSVLLNSEVIKTDIQSIETEEELDYIEENYETEDKTYDDDGDYDGDDDEEEVEDTDILFELYSKNDSCMEKYLKFEKHEFEEIIEKETDDKDGNDGRLNRSENNNVHLNTKPCDEFGTPLEPVLPSVEISRIELSSFQVQTVMLEPLVEIRKWQCSDCGRKYLTEEKLEQHRKLHKQSENCQCEICGSHLQSLYDYSVHMKSHATERKFSCEFCDKTFCTRANLKAHIYIHSNLRPFKCEICGKAFQQKSILKTHMTLHTGKPFECTVCHRRFSRTAHLNIHMRQHNNIRPYQCSQCPSSYMQKSHLDRHISSSHLGVRFQCTVCNKMYTKKPSLNTHMREEHCATVSLYNCEICGLHFPKQKGLYYHMKSKHPDYEKN